MQTVLLIENDPANLVAQALVLRSFGFTLVEARSRGEAWRACHRHQGPIHLVVAKATLDNHRTSDFIARLRLVYPQICALIVSETSSAELADNQSMPCEFAFLISPGHLGSYHKETARWTEEASSLFHLVTDWPTSRHGRLW